MNRNKSYANKRNKKNYKKGNGSNPKRVNPEDAEVIAEADNGGRPVHNNPNWYFRDPELANQVLQFSCAEFLGDDHPMDAPYDHVEVPSFCQIYLNPSPGWTDIDNPRTAGINILALKWYTWLSANNAKTTGYQPQDVMMLILAMGQAIAMIEHAKRAFKLCKTYNYRNRNFAKYAVEACGFQYDSLIANYADWRMHLNLVINNINKVPFISDIPYFDKCAQLYSQVYQDSESPMGQYYMYLPYSTWYLAEDEDPQGTKLTTTTRWNNLPVLEGHTVGMNLFITFIDGLINTLLTSTTFNLIYADILRISEKESVKMYTMPYLGMDDTLKPVYDPMMLYQIHNLDVAGLPDGTNTHTGYTLSNDVVPNVNGNYLEYRPYFTATAHSRYRDTSIIDFPNSMGMPDAVQKCELTRLKFVGKVEIDSTTNKAYLSKVAIPDHYVVTLRYVNNDPDDESMESNWIRTDLMSADDAVKFISKVDKFAYHPYIYADDNAVGAVTQLIGDMDFFTTLPFEWLRDANNFIYLTLFGRD